MKRVTASIAVLLIMVALTACNTMRGAGEDIERGGEAIQESASS